MDPGGFFAQFEAEIDGINEIVGWRIVFAVDGGMGCFGHGCLAF